MVVASFAALSVRSLPGIAEWPGIHRIKVEDKMELMNCGWRKFEDGMR